MRRAPHPLLRDERTKPPPFTAIGPQHHIRIQHRDERVEVSVARGEECIDDLSLTGEVGIRKSDGRTFPYPTVRERSRLVVFG